MKNNRTPTDLRNQIMESLKEAARFHMNTEIKTPPPHISNISEFVERGSIRTVMFKIHPSDEELRVHLDRTPRGEKSIVSLTFFGPSFTPLSGLNFKKKYGDITVALLADIIGDVLGKDTSLEKIARPERVRKNYTARSSGGGFDLSF